MDNIATLTIKLSNPNLSISDKLKAICRTIKYVVPNANRVSLWAFNDSFDKIFCLMSQDNSLKFQFGQQLHKTDFAPYFNFILNDRVLNASDARNHPVTSCFTTRYFEPLNIYSLLDLIFHHNFAPVGIICCEHLDEPVEWQEQDIVALQRIASITTLFFAKEIKCVSCNEDEIIATLTNECS